ncbi:MAG: DUF1287 domain-containing protein [Chitinivibrionales bacterium]|nr:DUF1287 domain-containing protein [Chitinivibrionales bacterium]
MDSIIASALRQTKITHTYDPGYAAISYPNGDIPLERGVCTDVVIRAFRSAGIDLQVLVHEDMSGHFAAYPDNWGLAKPDPNIDHRRVPNLMTYFRRQGKSLPVTDSGEDYIPGDIVTWKIPGNLDHIGIVVDRKVDGTDRYAVVHNIGRGAELEDVLFAFKITGHYRYSGP